MTLPADEKWARAATPGPWTAQAACRGQIDVFFAPVGRWEIIDVKVARIARAQAICRGCPVQADCLDFATVNREQHGVWGGVNLDRPRRPGRTKPPTPRPRHLTVAPEAAPREGWAPNPSSSKSNKPGAHPNDNRTHPGIGRGRRQT